MHAGQLLVGPNACSTLTLNEWNKYVHLCSTEINQDVIDCVQKQSGRSASNEKVGLPTKCKPYHCRWSWVNFSRTFRRLSKRGQGWGHLSLKFGKNYFSVTYDDPDIMKQTRSLYARANMIIRKLSSASLNTKLMLFRAYCTPIYGCQLWCSMYQYSYNSENSLVNAALASDVFVLSPVLRHWRCILFFNFHCF